MNLSDCWSATGSDRKREGLNPILGEKWMGSIDSCGLPRAERGIDRNRSRNIVGRRHQERQGEKAMIDLDYSLVIEATEEPNYFGFYSPDLEGFTGIGHSVEDCLYKARWGMREHVNVLKERGLSIPPKNPNPKIVIQNEQLAEKVV